MSYKVYIDQHGTGYPQFYCDICGEPITDLTLGNTVFRSEASSDTIHDHKECDHRAKTQGYNNWHDLTSDLVWLPKRYGWVTKEGKVTKAMTDAIERVN
jgi:hypothetical protein